MRRQHRGLPEPVRPRRAWFVFATTAVLGTIAATVAPSPWSILCGALAAIGAIGAFFMFVAITVLEDDEDARDARPRARGERAVQDRANDRAHDRAHRARRRRP